MTKIDVCFVPELTQFYQIEDKIVVVADIFRATTSIVTALALGVKSIIPVATIEECETYQAKGFMAAGERNGLKLDHFDLGNSPYEFMDEKLKGKSIAFTTTNGTRAIDKTRTATQVLCGAFVNISFLAEYLKKAGKDVLIVCAGWKGKYSVEDSLFAGALVDMLGFDSDCDASLSCQTMYRHVKHDISGFLANSSHARRLTRKEIARDVDLCLTFDLYQVIPVLTGSELMSLKVEQAIWQKH